MADREQQLLGPLRAAVQRYGMIGEKDRVAVGVSGGKDSLTLLVLLAKLRRFYPLPFTLTAITLDPCFGGEETDFGPVEALCRELDLPVKLVHARAEEGGRRPELRERYDVASARAVAALPTLCEYCLPFVRPGGIFLAMKGPEGETEQTAAANAVRMLGGKVRRVKALTLPALPDGEPGGERRILVIDKIAPTPPKYPRPSAKIAKQPL